MKISRDRDPRWPKIRSIVTSKSKPTFKKMLQAVNNESTIELESTLNELMGSITEIFKAMDRIELKQKFEKVTQKIVSDD
jgi:hypothetical protein